ncbi:MAG: transporter [Deltaproteobacteria bacterium]|nr:transporter [Deltaproteobacteria bacterium]
MRGKCWLRGMVFLALCMVFGVEGAWGAGFALYEGSARGIALGGAVVGRADDPSALFYNPAGITQLPGLQLMTGVAPIMPSTDVTTTVAGVSRTTTTEDNVWLPPHFYATYQVTDRVWLGLGFFSPFGLGTEFDENWPGRYNSYRAVIQSLTLNPNIAIKLNDQFSLAAGLEAMWFDLDLRQKIPVTRFGDVDQTLKGDSFGYGFNVGLRYQPCRYFAFGASYRSQVTQHVEGRADFSKPTALAQLFPASFRDTDASGTITLPDMLFLGAVFYPTPRISLEIGSVLSRWSTYDALTIRYDNPVNLVTRNINSVIREKNWHDTWRFQTGLEFKATNWLDLRLGYVFDEEPAPTEFADYLVPANDRHLLNFGTGIHFGNWVVDLAYTYLIIEDRDNVLARADGVLNSSFSNGDAHIFGLSLGYKF